MFKGKCKCGDMNLVSKRYLRSWSKQKCVKCNSSLIIKDDNNGMIRNNNNKIQKEKESGGKRKKSRNMRRKSLVQDRKYVKICPKFTCSSTIKETYLEKPFEMMKVSYSPVILDSELSDMGTDIDVTYELLMLILDNENKKFGMKCNDVVMNDVFWDM